MSPGGMFRDRYCIFFILQNPCRTMGLIDILWPVFFPLRFLATIYADIFRAVPGVLVIYILGFGIPGLGLPGIPTDPFPYAVHPFTHRAQPMHNSRLI